MAKVDATNVNFLVKDPIYGKEKPYLLLYDPPEGFSNTNIRTQCPPAIAVSDMRAMQNNFTLEKNGFEIIKLHSKLDPECFDDADTVKAVYLQEVGDAIRERFNAQKVQVFEHIVRKRHSQFPVATGKPYKWDQPASIAHVDTTPEWTRAMVRRLNSPKVAQGLLQHQIRCVNVWRPIRGPVRDWPLAVGDPRTIDKADLHNGDLVYDSYVVENQQVHYSPDQEWFYVRDQMPDEAWVFIQSYSEPDEHLPGVPHFSFELPPVLDKNNQPVAMPPRESVEVRCMVYL